MITCFFFLVTNAICRSFVYLFVFSFSHFISLHRFYHSVLVSLDARTNVDRKTLIFVYAFERYVKLYMLTYARVSFSTKFLLLAHFSSLFEHRAHYATLTSFVRLKHLALLHFASTVSRSHIYTLRITTELIVYFVPDFDILRFIYASVNTILWMQNEKKKSNKKSNAQQKQKHIDWISLLTIRIEIVLNRMKLLCLLGMCVVEITVIFFYLSMFRFTNFTKILIFIVTHESLRYLLPFDTCG